MYTAKVEGQSIDVDNISISFRLKNPMFDPNSGMEWSATYPFKLPNTIRNRSVFGYPNRTSLKDKHVRDYSFEHYFNGIRLPGDTIRVTLAGGSEIEAYVKIGRSDFISINKDKYLHELGFPSVYYQAWDPNNTDYPYFWGALAEGYPNFPYALFPVENSGFYKNTHLETWWTDSSQNEFGPYQNMFYWNPGLIFNPGCITPFPIVASVMDQIFADSNYELTQNIFASIPELSRLCIFNPNRAIYYLDGLSGFDYASFSIADHLPKMKIPQFLMNMRVPFGADFYFNNFARKARMITRKEVIMSTDIVDISKNVQGECKVTIENSPVKFRFSLKPSEKDEYFSQCVTDFTDYVNDPITAYPTFADLPPGASSRDLAYVMAEDKIYIYDYDDELETNVWRILTYNLLPYVNGEDPEIIIEGEVGVLINELNEYKGIATPSFDWATPVVIQPGNNSRKPLTTKTQYSDFGLQLVFDRGYSKTSHNKDYRLGSSFNYDYFPHEVGDPEYSLRWDGDEQQAFFRAKGLYRKFWKEWLAWRKTTRQIEFTKAFTPYELFTLDFSKKHFALNTVMILEEINFTVTNRSIKPAKVKAWTV